MVISFIKRELLYTIVHQGLFLSDHTQSLGIAFTHNIVQSNIVPNFKKTKRAKPWSCLCQFMAPLERELAISKKRNGNGMFLHLPQKKLHSFITGHLLSYWLGNRRRWGTREGKRREDRSIHWRTIVCLLPLLCPLWSLCLSTLIALHSSCHYPFTGLTTSICVY